MESLIAGLGVAAGAGWGVAGGLAVALWVALRHIVPTPPSAESAIHVLRREEDTEFPNFGQRRA